jgi:hypothetical protein
MSDRLLMMMMTGCGPVVSQITDEVDKLRQFYYVLKFWHNNCINNHYKNEIMFYTAITFTYRL